MQRIFFALLAAAVLLSGCATDGLPVKTKTEAGTFMDTTYSFPAEDSLHEGTWLNWPHAYTYGTKYRNELEPIWVAMVRALHTSERVHLVVYNESEQKRVAALLGNSSVDMAQVDFVLAKSDDVWARDTGPMFVYDDKNVLTILDFAFDGWGEKTPYRHDDAIPRAVASAKEFPLVAVPRFVLEGGSIELDGAGTLMACRSSVISKNRNQGFTQEQAEDYFRTCLGTTHFIWLEGATDEDITDAHIDGIARFYDSETLLTVSKDNFLELYETIPEHDYEMLLSARNAKGIPYQIIELPMTAKNVKGLDYKGSYLNFYIGNNAVLLPVYRDANDAVAAEVLTRLYPDRKVVSIDVTALYQYGGMLHCVTQQQPAR